MGESSHSWFVLPLFKEGDPPKVFVAQVESDESEKILTERLIWETFAAQASILLDWVDLRSQMAGSLRREQRLAEMMRIITSEVELPLILQNVVQTAVEILDADCVVFWG